MLGIAGLPEPLKHKPSDTIPFLYLDLPNKIVTHKPSPMERLGNMQRKRFFLVFMVSCVCFLPLDADAQAGAVGKILKGTTKAAKSHSYGFSRAGIIAAKEFEKNNRLNRNHDSIYMDSMMKWNTLNESQFSNQRRLKDIAPYEESAIKEVSVAEDTNFISDTVVQTFETDSLKMTVNTKENADKSNETTTFYLDENDSIARKLSLGLMIFIALIICCSLKFFVKKRGSR